MIFDNILHWIISKYTKLDDIALHNHNTIILFIGKSIGSSYTYC